MLDRGMTIFATARLALLGMSLALGGCASQPGAILAGPPADPADLPFTAFLTPADDEYFWITAEPHSNHELQPGETQVPKQGLWLQQGVFFLEFECFSPKKAPHVAYPILPEYGDMGTLYIKGGRRYQLRCDDYRMGRVVLTDEGSLPGL